MPWGELYIQPFTGRCLTRAAFTFGARLAAFRAACEKLGAKPISHGDAGYEFPFFGPYAMEILVWEGDDEFPPSAQILYTGNFACLLYTSGWRLACGCKVMGDAEILVPDIASAYQSRMKTADLSSPEEVALFTAIQQDVQAAGIAFETGFRALSIALAEPTLDDTMPDDERLIWAIQEAAGVEQVDLPYPVMVKLAGTLREFGFQVTVKGLLDVYKRQYDTTVVVF